jgi:hypothetical protein
MKAKLADNSANPNSSDGNKPGKLVEIVSRYRELGFD